MSEFGKGLGYCLGLFLCHSERELYKDEVGIKFQKEQDERIRKGNNNDYSFSTEMWFNGASDHLYEMNIPNKFSKKLRIRLKVFQDNVLRWGHGFKNDVTKKDKRWAIQEAKDLLLEIDKINGIEAEKGDFE